MPRMLSLILSLFISAPALASTACPDVSGVVQEVIFLDYKDCELAKELADSFNDMAQTFAVASQVTLVIGGPMDNASFDNGHIIQVPYRMVFYGDYGTEYPVPINSLMISASHEYGHAIFQEYLKKSLPQFADLFAAFNARSDKKLVLLRGGKDDSLMEDAKRLAETAEYKAFYKLTPYSEFYADVLAVFIHNDKSAMLRALYYPQMSPFQYNYIRMRDFEGEPDPRWSSLMYEEHSKLAYVRSYVGKSMWPENRAEARTRAGQIVNAILNVVQINLAQGNDPDVQDANNQLIEELKKTP